LGDNIDIIKKYTETLVVSNKEVGLEVYAVKTKYMLLSRHQNTGRNHKNIGNNIVLKCSEVQIFGNISYIKHLVKSK
jgi:hypothetical protein